MSAVNFESSDIAWYWEPLDPLPESGEKELDLETALEPPLKRARLATPSTAEGASSPLEKLPPFLQLFPVHTYEKMEWQPTDRYVEEEGVLGAGTYGKVVKGKDLESGLPVALKIHHHAKQMGIAKAEATLLEELSHQGACHRLNFQAAFHRSSSEYVIVTDLVPADNIHQTFLLPESPASPLTFSEIITIGRQSLEFLHSLKTKKIIHGDLRIDNMIFERTSRYLTILDYGKSSKKRSFPYESTLQVLWQRSPEEILRGRLNCSHDIWTLGCILYQIFTGTTLFPATQEESLDKHRQLICRMVKHIGLPSRNFLLKCSHASSFFTFADAVQLADGPCQMTQSWKKSIRSKGALMGISNEQIEQFIQLLEGMLRWENRRSPRELLRSPLFHDDVKLHLSSGFTSNDLITLYRHAETSDPALGPSLRLDLSDHVTRTCCHIQRDPKNLYNLIVYRNGAQIFQQCLRLQDGDTLNL